MVLKDYPCPRYGFQPHSSFLNAQQIFYRPSNLQAHSLTSSPYGMGFPDRHALRYYDRPLWALPPSRPLAPDARYIDGRFGRLAAYCSVRAGVRGRYAG